MTEQTSPLVKIGAILAALLLVLVNVHYFFNESYVRMQDNLNEKQVLSIRYQEVLQQEDSLSNRVSLYMVDEPAEKDSGLIEKIGIACMGAGALFLLLGALSVYTKNRKTTVMLGALLSCAGTGCLYGVVAMVEQGLKESLVGTLESFLGGSLIQLKTTSGTLLIINLVLGAVICLLANACAKGAAPASAE